MTKITITNKLLETHMESLKPAFININNKGIYFNPSAAKLLSLKADSKFVLEVEDGKIYYADSASNAESLTVKTELRNALYAPASNIKNFLTKYISIPNAEKLVRYNIGEIKDGRRLLALAK